MTERQDEDMKYIKQMCVIGGVSFVAEILHGLLPLPVPASVYGLVLMTILLISGMVKPEQIEETADYLISIMPVFFIPPTVGLIVSFADIKGSVLKLLLICILSIIVVMAVTGHVAQFIIRFGKKRKESKKHE